MTSSSLSHLKLHRLRCVGRRKETRELNRRQSTPKTKKCTRKSTSKKCMWSMCGSPEESSSSTLHQIRRDKCHKHRRLRCNSRTCNLPHRGAPACCPWTAASAGSDRPQKKRWRWKWRRATLWPRRTQDQLLRCGARTP